MPVELPPNRIVGVKFPVLWKGRFPATPTPFVTAAARLADVGVAKNVAMPAPSPATPEEMGRPVQFVRVPLAGVPNAGVVSVGLVRVLFVKV